jgi:hypothetical protein
VKWRTQPILAAEISMPLRVDHSRLEARCGL